MDIKKFSNWQTKTKNVRWTKNSQLVSFSSLKGLEVVETWGKGYKILRHGYNGGGWDGNNSKRILDHADDLRDLPNYLEIMPAIDALKSLKPVIEGE